MSDVWRACKEFLLSANLDDVFGIKKVKSLYDMYSILSDGVLLCSLLDVICSNNSCLYQKGSRVTLYRSITNVTQFIMGCRDILKIQEEDIFEISDLTEGQNINAVFYTLSCVSQTPQSRKLNLQPFICPKNSPVCKFNQDFFSPMEKPEIDQVSESVYDNAPTVCSTYLNADSFIKEFSEHFVLDPKEAKGKYDHSVQELLSTEKRYFEGHIMLMSHLYDYLSQKLSFSELNLMFNNFQNMKNAQNTIIQSFYKNHFVHRRNLGATVIKHKALFLEYVPYISKLQGAGTYADRIWKDSKMKQGLIETVKSFDPNFRLFDLKSVLMVPMQHITRYQLHFNAMLKNCKDDEKAHAELEKGLEEITDVLAHINQASNDETSLEDIQILQARFISSSKGVKMPYLRDFGHILFQSEIFIRFLKDPKKIHSRIGLIFDTKFLIAKPNSSKLVLELMISYSDYTFKSNFNNKYAIESVNVEAKPNRGLEISNNFTMSFGSKNYVTDKFMASLATCLTMNNIPDSVSKMHSLKITNFSNNECCSICNKLLGGLLSQGYHCNNRGCNVNAHITCLSSLSSCYSDAQAGMAYDGSHSKTKRSGTSVHGNDPNDPDTTMPVEIDLEKENWFGGKCTRLEAQEMLSPLMDGSFLVRMSDNVVGGYVISFKYDNQVRHIKVSKEKGFYLYELRRFPKIRDMISYYQLNSMQEAYDKYNTCLLNPVREGHKKIEAPIDNFIKKTGFVKFDAGDLVTILSDYNEHVWVVKVGTEVGYCYSCILQPMNPAEEDLKPEVNNMIRQFSLKSN